MTTDSITAQNDAQQLDVSQLIIGVLGGTGEQGRGLARRLAMSGQRVIIGSRDASRAQGIADEIYILFEGALIANKVHNQVWPVLIAKRIASQLIDSNH